MILTFILQFNTLVDYSKIAYIVSTLNKWRRTRTRTRTRIRTIPTPKKTSLCNNDSLTKLSSEIQFYHSIKHKNQTHKPRLKTYKSQKKKKKEEEEEEEEA